MRRGILGKAKRLVGLLVIWLNDISFLIFSGDRDKQAPLKNTFLKSSKSFSASPSDGANDVSGLEKISLKSAKRAVGTDRCDFID